MMQSCPLVHAAALLIATWMTRMQRLAASDAAAASQARCRQQVTQPPGSDAAAGQWRSHQPGAQATASDTSRQAVTQPPGNGADTRQYHFRRPVPLPPGTEGQVLMTLRPIASDAAVPSDAAASQ